MPIDPSQRPRDYMCLSVFTTFCCWCVVGLIAMYFSCQTQEAVRMGDLMRAQQNSRNARMLNILGIVVGTVILIIIISTNV